MNKLKLYLQLARLNKPVGILLLLAPTLWALWLANHGMPTMRLLVIFILGTLTTRTAGCIINDIFDRHIDPHVSRTKQRPLACAALSLTEAWILFVGFGLASLGLLWQLNRLAIILGIAAAIIACLYPLMKRLTHFPQLVLGVAFSMGIPMAFAACSNQLSTRCLLLFMIGVLWSIVYDTAYALTDVKDDAMIGVKSTALFFKHHSARFIAILQTLIILGFIFLGWLEHLSWFFYLGLLISALLFFYQQHLLKNQQPFAVFLNNQWLGLIIWLGIVLGLL